MRVTQSVSSGLVIYICRGRVSREGQDIVFVPLNLVNRRNLFYSSILWNSNFCLNEIESKYFHYLIIISQNIQIMLLPTHPESQHCSSDMWLLSELWKKKCNVWSMPDICVSKDWGVVVPLFLLFTRLMSSSRLLHLLLPAWPLDCLIPDTDIWHSDSPLTTSVALHRSWGYRDHHQILLPLKEIVCVKPLQMTKVTEEQCLRILLTKEL